MRETGRDMQSKNRQTSLGGLYRFKWGEAPGLSSNPSGGF